MAALEPASALGHGAHPASDVCSMKTASHPNPAAPQGLQAPPKKQKLSHPSTNEPYTENQSLKRELRSVHEQIASLTARLETLQHALSAQGKSRMRTLFAPQSEQFFYRLLLLSIMWASCEMGC